MMNKSDDFRDLIDIQQLTGGIYRLSLQNATDQGVVFDQNLFYHCLNAQLETLSREDCQGVFFRLSGAFRTNDYATRIKEADAVDQAPLRSELLQLTRKLLTNQKPRVVAFDQLLSGDVLSFVLQFDARIAIGERAGFSFSDATVGLIHGWGSIPRILERLPAQYYVPLFLQGAQLRDQELLASNLADATFEEWKFAEDESCWERNPMEKKTWCLGAEVDEGRQAIIGRINDRSLYSKVLTGLLMDVKDATIGQLLTREQSGYLRLLKSRETTARIRVNHYGIRSARKNCTENKLEFPLRKISVIGAGMMGAGIAYQAAKCELMVVLKDVSRQQAIKGRKQVEKLANRLASKGKMQEQAVDDLLRRIHPTERAHDMIDSDVIIEAVFEDRQLKQDILQQVEELISAGGILASNTTSLPISSLSKNITNSSRFIGLHFFSPVDRMPLVEVIRGEKTSKETLGKALALVDRLGKIPIVVSDGPGFFTSRIFFNYLLEGISMLLEGVPIQQIEESARQTGLAVGPLAVLDEISLPLMVQVYAQFPQLSPSQERAVRYLKKMIANGRTGRRNGGGFYDYPKDRSKEYWLDKNLPTNREAFNNEELGFRLLAVMALDGFRCLEEGVLQSPLDGDLGVVLGLGYPAYTGGLFGLMDWVGLPRFVRICESYREYGEQWGVPDSLKDLARKDYRFYESF